METGSQLPSGRASQLPEPRTWECSTVLRVESINRTRSSGPPQIPARARNKGNPNADGSRFSAQPARPHVVLSSRGTMGMLHLHFHANP
jgi:hypothetical protein